MVSLEVESSIWWGFIIFIAASRFISRRMTLGSFRRFQGDDYCMLVTLCFYTTLIVTINIVRHSNSNLFPPGFDIAALTPEQISDREFGSKMVLVVEQSQCVTIWGAKICLLILYHRLTQLRWENLGIKILTGYVVVSFVVMEVLYFAVWCRPFHEYWAVPTNSTQCNAATNHLITNAVFNLSSDVILMAIGLPMFLRMKLPWQKKLPLVLVFSLGLFDILAAVLNKVYSFSQPFGNMWSYWYVRESSTALLVANLPFVWHFWRKITGYNTVVTRRSASTHMDTGLSHPNTCPIRDNSMLDLSSFLAEGPPDDRSAPERTTSSAGNRIRNSLKKSFSRDRVPQNKQSTGSEHGDDFPRAITSDKPVRDTVRRDSDPNRHLPGTDEDSTQPSSMASTRSAGSFV